MCSILEFEREMFLSVLNENSLSIASKGIAIDRLLLQLTKAYSEKSQLVFVIGTNLEIEEHILSELSETTTPEKTAVNEVPKRVTAESFAANERTNVYMSGGVVFITSRILVVDMLTERVPFKLISGIIVYNAHTILNDCIQAFILRLYRMNNKTGFVTALSQSSNAFIGGFGKVERIMRYLFVTKLFLWPRFHATITSSLNSRSAPNVLEMRLSMTPLMRKIQFSLMDLISLCIKELTNSNNSFLYESEDLNIMNVISLNFDKFVRTQFDPIWYQLSAKSRRIINDIKLLKTLLFHLTQYDCVVFYTEIKAIRQNVVLNSETSDWLFWDQSEVLFTASKQRLFSEKNGKQVIDIEINPKWNAFNEVIAEIDSETKDISQTIDVIVIVENSYSTQRLEKFRDKGVDTVLDELKKKCELLLNGTKDEKRKSVNKEVKRDENVLTLTQMLKSYNETEEVFKNEHRLEFHYHNWHQKGIHLENMLSVLRPKYIILYEPDMQSIRQIEIYQALYCSPQSVKVYFFMFDGSAEEQRYLKNLHIEKESFEVLIKTKASMVIPSDRDGKSDSHPDLIRDTDEEVIITSRKAGGQASQQTSRQRIIIDVREFRSDLPTLIHKRGIDIEPITLEIGDYILTPDTCVERKSVSDLIGSLNNGRLYHQTEIMTRYYKRPLLLIEFDDQKSFNFKGRYWGITASSASHSSSSRPNVMSQLVLLTIKFPLLRLVWSPSPHFSSQVFQYLKEDKEEPEAKQVLSLSNTQLPSEYVNDKYDIAAKEFLLCLPGIDINNVYSIMNKVKCIADLVDLSIEELTEIMGSIKNAESLYNGLHLKLIDDNNEDNKANNDKKRKRFAKKAKV